MRILLGGVPQTTLVGDSANINRAMSDPVPTCSLTLKDNTSSIFPQYMQELLVLDDQLIPNPTVNLLLNSNMLPYNTTWGAVPASGVSLSQNTGGGVIITTTNVATVRTIPMSQGIVTANPTPGMFTVVAGQKYVFSLTAKPNSTIGVSGVTFAGFWYDAAGNSIGSFSPVDVPFTSPTLAKQYSVTMTPPANTVYFLVEFGLSYSSSTNSGSVTITNAQLEPLWFPTIAYPTPYCGPNQTNCVQLPNTSVYIRQYRKFAGFVNHVTYGDYEGNVRNVQIDAVGYAWLLSSILCNNTYSSHTDAFIIKDLLSTYLPGFCNTLAVITGVTLSSVQSNWDDLRSIFDNLASQSGYYWTIDYYWNAIYAPPGYFSMPISLICDNSSPAPDFVTSFTAYDFSAEMDYTQPGSTILTLGNGANTAEVIDPAAIAVINQNSGYTFKAGSAFMRKVNENSLNSVADCTQRGIAELLQSDYPRNIYHVSTQAELIPGESIQLTSNTDNLNKTTLLIQQTKAQWIGTDETRTDTWEYQSDLGATNRSSTHILSRLFRLTNGNSAATAIAAFSLAAIESIGLIDNAATGTYSLATYAATILADGPVAYYRLGETLGTTADDYSGSAFQGTFTGGFTLNQTGAILNDSNAAVNFNGTSGYIALPAGLSTNAWTNFTVECWVKLTSTPTVGNPRIIDNSKTDVDFHGFELIVNRVGLTLSFSLGTGTVANTITTTSALVVNTYTYVSASFNGTQMILYFNGVQQAATTFTSFSINASSNPVNIGRNVTGADNWLPGTVDEPAIYHATLTRYQIQQHYLAGSSPYGLAVRADSPLAYYRLDELTGTTAYDWSGNSYDGTLNGGITLNQAGALTLSGDNDPAMTFNGTTGFITLPGGLSLNGASAFSVEAWVKFTGSFVTFPRFLASDDAQNNLVGFDFGLNPSASGGAFLNIAVNGVWKQAIFHTVLSTSTWYHLAGTYDGANLRIYLNGSVVATTAATGTLTATANILQIGRMLNTQFFPGLIDEPAVYTTALSAARVLVHYNAGI